MTPSPAARPSQSESPPASAGGHATLARPPAIELGPEAWRLALIVAAVVVAFGAAIANGWVIDDHQTIELNPHVRSWASVPTAFTSTVVNSSDPYFQYATWRPLRHVSFVLDYHVAGLNPAWFHAVNVALHALGAVLLYGVLRGLAAGPGPAMLGALVYAVHPVQTEVVAQAKERDGLLASAFFLGALVLVRCPTPVRVVASSALLACSLLSKESAVVGPVLLAVVAWLWSRHDGISWRRWWPAVATWLLVAMAFVVLRHLVIGRTAQMAAMADTRGALLWTMLEVYARYLGLVAWPLELPLSFTDIQPRGWSAPGPWLGLVLLLATVAAIVWGALRRPLVGLGLAWFLVALAPVANIIPMQQWMAVRFLFLPMAGLAMVVAGLATWWSTDGAAASRRPVAMLAASLLVAGMIVVSALRTMEWRNNDTLWTAEYLMKPTTLEARRGMAAALVRQRRYQEALDVLGTWQWPARPTSMHEQTVAPYATALYQTGRRDEALAFLDQAHARWPSSPRFAHLFAQMLWSEHHQTAATEVLELLVARRPGEERSWRLLELIYEEQGRTEDLARVRARQARLGAPPPPPTEGTGVSEGSDQGVALP